MGEALIQPPPTELQVYPASPPVEVNPRWFDPENKTATPLLTHISEDVADKVMASSPVLRMLGGAPVVENIYVMGSQADRNASNGDLDLYIEVSGVPRIENHSQRYLALNRFATMAALGATSPVEFFTTLSQMPKSDWVDVYVGTETPDHVYKNEVGTQREMPRFYSCKKKQWICFVNL